MLYREAVECYHRVSLTCWVNVIGCGVRRCFSPRKTTPRQARCVNIMDVFNVINVLNSSNVINAINGINSVSKTACANVCCENLTACSVPQ